MKRPPIVNSERSLGESDDGRVFIEAAAATGDPVDYVMRYRLLLPRCKERKAWIEATETWTRYWALMRKAAALALVPSPPAEPQWRLTFQLAEVEKETSPAKISLIAARAQRLLLSRLRSRSPEECPDTPEGRITVLALAYCANLRKDPNLILHAGDLELKTLALAAEEFGAAHEIQP